jgi:1-pyrroline-5-carboxylate dehydrogenase
MGNIIDPMNGEFMLNFPFTNVDELRMYADSLSKCPKSGLHNPLRNTERYNLYGSVCHKAAALMHEVT